MAFLNTINYSEGSNFKKPYISASTKRKLESLGIDPTLVTSETQALSLIASRQSEKSFEQYTKQINSIGSPQAESSSKSETTSDLYSAMNYQANNTKYMFGL